MAEPTTFTTNAVNWGDIGDQLMQGAMKAATLGDLRKTVVSTFAEKDAAIAGVVFDVGIDIATAIGETLHKLEAPFLPFVAAFTAPIVQALFDANVNEETFKRRLAKGGGAAAGQSIVDGLFKAIEGTATADLTPSRDGARRIAGAAVAASLESTFNAMVPELLSDMLGEWGPRFTAFTELPENIIRTLGVSRLVRRAVGPLVTVTCTTPLEWEVNRRYRPTLLGTSTIAKQIARGRGNAETWREQLARQGHSEANIEALLNEQRHFFSAGDVRTLVYRKHWQNEQGIAHLKDQGYDDAAANDAIRLEGIRRIEQLENGEATAIVSAYVDRLIDDATLAGALNAAISVPEERALLTESAQVRRAVNIRRLTLSQVERMVKSRVLSVIDYRRAAEREGYPDEDVVALELQLRFDLNEEKSIADHRAELEASRAAEKKARDAAAAAKRAEVEAARVLARRGSEADLERAVVRGLIPLARLEEVYAAHYDPDTVAILVASIEQDRVDYVAQQKKRDEAEQRGVSRGIDVGSIDRAVLDGVLTVSQYRDRLRALNFSDADADLLTADLQARVTQRAAAERARQDATEAARRKSIDLGRFETLVRRGHRTIAQYDQLLTSLGFDPASRAAMVELLQIHIADDVAARQAREAADAKLRAKGLSFEQARRAVILGVRDEPWFERFLTDQGFTTEAQAVLVDELRAGVTEAEAARQRRAKGAVPVDTSALPLATVRKAARLGLISIDAYRARLAKAGYSDDDIELDVDLLLVEIADVQESRATAGAPVPDTAPRGLTLEQLARAVKSGNATLDDYRARAAALGYGADDIQTLSAVLEDELVSLTAARQARAAIDVAAGGKDLTLAQLEDGVKHDLLTVDDYRAELLTRGYDPDETDLLAALLIDDIEAAAAKAQKPQ